MAGAPDLFVVCKNCGSEVSPYITECPYCGNRLRKRAPKIERDADGESRPREPRRGPRPSLGRLMPGEIPGIRADNDRRPYATMALVAFGALGFIVLAFLSRADVGLLGVLGSQYWRLLLTPFFDVGSWGQFASLLTVAIFGTLLERRHGPVLVLVVWLLAATGGAGLVAAVEDFPVAFGANAGALGLLAAWAVPVLLARRARPHEDDDVDLLGAAVIAAVVALLPIAGGYSWLAELWGAVAGALVGLVLARTSPR